MQTKPKATVTLAQQSPYAPIFAVNMACIPVMSTDRCLPRKEQAALTRKLFKSLGIKGVSVTAPNYSMAQSVDVRLPAIPRCDGDDVLNGVNYENHTYSNMPDALPCKAKMLAKRQAANRIEEILARAFPNHNDRSDTQTDYFDYCWSID